MTKELSRDAEKRKDELVNLEMVRYTIVPSRSIYHSLGCYWKTIIEIKKEEIYDKRKTYL